MNRKLKKQFKQFKKDINIYISFGSKKKKDHKYWNKRSEISE